MHAYRSISILSVLACAALIVTRQAQAADAPATPAVTPAVVPPYTATSNINLVSDYRFRGIDQTWGRPAVQGGFDISLPSGLYAGVWASNVSGNSYPGGSLEMDLYGGYNGKVNDDLAYTAGFLAYLYPGANYNKSACPSAAYSTPCALPSQSLNTLELNAGVTWKWIGYKLSLSTGDYFGANGSTGYSKGSRGTAYHDLTLTYPISDSLSLVGHVGRTDVKASYGSISPDYTDYRVTLAKTFDGGWIVSAAVAGANNNPFFRPPTGGLSLANGDTRAVNRNTVVLQAGRAF